jgi:regulatory protein
MDELTRAKKRALYLLTDMDRTEAQLYEKLKKTGYSEETIAKAMAYVKGYGYINDEKYAEHYLEVMQESRSKLRIRMDLQKKGVPKDIIDRTFELYGDYDERPLIRKLAAKKMRTLPSDDPKSRQKAAAFLGRKGFQSHDIYEVLGELS